MRIRGAAAAVAEPPRIEPCLRACRATTHSTCTQWRRRSGTPSSSGPAWMEPPAWPPAGCRPKGCASPASPRRRGGPRDDPARCLPRRAALPGHGQPGGRVHEPGGHPLRGRGDALRTAAFLDLGAPYARQCAPIGFPLLTRLQGRLEFTNPGSPYPQLAADSPSVWRTSTCAPAALTPSPPAPCPHCVGGTRSPTPWQGSGSATPFCARAPSSSPCSGGTRCVYAAPVTALPPSGAPTNTHTHTLPPGPQVPLGMLSLSLFLRALEFYSLSRAFAVRSRQRVAPARTEKWPDLPPSPRPPPSTAP